MEKELNEKWNIHKIVQEAVKSSHSQSAPETRERLLALELTSKNFMDSFEEFKINNEKGHQSIIEAVEKLEHKLESALEEKANIWVETLIKWIGGIIGLGLLGYFGTLIIKLINIQ